MELLRPKQQIKRSDSIFSRKDIDVICLSEVKNWKKSTPLNNYIVATETCNNGHHGSAILVKKSIVIKRTEPKKEKPIAMVEHMKH